MRPPKRVLLYCGDELTLSGLKFRLGVWGYRVEEFWDLKAVERRLRARSFDLVLMVPDRDEKTWEAFERSARSIQIVQENRFAELRVYAPEGVIRGEMAAGVPRIFPGSEPWSGLREGIRMALCRKRGPRPEIVAEYAPTGCVA